MFSLLTLLKLVAFPFFIFCPTSPKKENSETHTEHLKIKQEYWGEAWGT